MVACRCSPMRKADVVGLLQQHTRKVCCIGDGGNDDSKIRATNVGVFDLLLIHKRNADSTLTRQTSLSCSWFLRYTILLPNKILSSHFCLFSDLCDTRKALSNSSRCFASFISWREQISNQVFSHMLLQNLGTLRPAVVLPPRPVQFDMGQIELWFSPDSIWAFPNLSTSTSREFLNIPTS